MLKPNAHRHPAQAVPPWPRRSDCPATPRARLEEVHHARAHAARLRLDHDDTEPQARTRTEEPSHSLHD